MVGIPETGLSLRLTESFDRTWQLHNFSVSKELYQPNINSKMDDSKGMEIAFEEARQSYSEGGIPVSETGVVQA